MVGKCNIFCSALLRIIKQMTFKRHQLGAVTRRKMPFVSQCNFVIVLTTNLYLSIVPGAVGVAFNWTGEGFQVILGIFFPPYHQMIMVNHPRVFTLSATPNSIALGNHMIHQVFDTPVQQNHEYISKVVLAQVFLHFGTLGCSYQL